MAFTLSLTLVLSVASMDKDEVLTRAALSFPTPSVLYTGR